MRSIVSIGFGLLASTTLLGATTSGGAIPGPYCLPVAKELRSTTAQFSLSALDGTTLAFSNQDGKATVVALFATWCGPCNQEMPDLLDMAHRYAKQGLRTVLVDDREPPEKVRTFAQKFSIDLPIGLDPDGTVFHLFALHYIPATLFYNSKGVLTCITADEASAATSDWMP